MVCLAKSSSIKSLAFAGGSGAYILRNKAFGKTAGVSDCRDHPALSVLDLGRSGAHR